MKKLKLIASSILCVVILMSVLTTCSESPTGPFVELTLEQKIALTPRANAEAENMALFLSGELLAPESLYQGLVIDLRNFRDQYRDSLPFVDSVGYGPHKPTNFISITLTESAMEELRVGNYVGLDSLNGLFKGEMIDTAGMFDTIPLVTRPEGIVLIFEGRYNPDSLAVRYMKAPGVSSTIVSRHFENRSRLLTGEVGGSRVFLLHKCWENGSVSCLQNQYYYFIENRSGFELVASWGSEGGQITVELQLIVEEMLQAYFTGTF